MLYAIILLPVAGAILAALLPSEQLRPWLVPMVSLTHLVLVGRALLLRPPVPAGALFGLDALGALILLVVSLLFAASSVYALGYFSCHESWGNRIFIVCLLLFLAAMSVATMARHLGLLWVAVEATTLVSAPMIYYNHNRFSIEATWKYLLICSVGIALAMLGILFVAYAGLKGSNSTDLGLEHILVAAAGFSKPWLRAGFIFLLVGFGTKMGLAPLHTWKPDAYGEAPGLVSGLLAGGLTSVAFLAVLRAVQIMRAAGEATLAHQALLGLGVASLIIAAVFVIQQRDIKRMLAYSSVEHMGILAIGVAVGGIATFGAMFHVMNNALTKNALFLAAGNIHRYYGSKRKCEIFGSFTVLPFSAGIFLIGFLAITGSPPFAPFLSEFTILRGIFNGGHFLLGAVFLLLLVVVFIGMGSTVLPVTLGPALEEQPQSPYFRETLLTVLSPIVLLSIVLLLGLYLPAPLHRLFSDAAALVEVTP
ncbi:MAG: proton-conducting transporter membrane subunit [Deltaproteobacteria bacterium]